MKRFAWLSAALLLGLGFATPARATVTASVAIAPIPKPPADSNLQQDEVFDLIIRLNNASTGPDISTFIPATLKAGAKINVTLACKETSCVTPLPGTLTYQNPGGNGCVSNVTGVASCASGGPNLVVLTIDQDIVLPAFPTDIDIATIRLKASTPVTNPASGAFNLVASTENILNIQACTVEDGCVNAGAEGTTPFLFPGGTTTPTPTPTRTPTPTPTLTPTPSTPTPTPSPTPTKTPTPTPTKTPRPTPSATSNPPCDDGSGGGKQDCEAFNPYKNESGISTATVPPGMTLNPGKTGQWLWGTYYDVRPVRNASTGSSDAQDVNIQILNTNPRSSSFDCFNPYGGVIARVRFRESKTSREVLDFDILLSCAEVWTAKIELKPGDDLPTITSNDPIRIATSDSQFTTGPALAAGKKFTVPVGLKPADVQRGYFEVIAEEALPCEPVDCEVDRTGDIWDRLPEEYRTPSNALSAEVILIRVAAGVSHIYNAEAVTRYVAAGGGSVLNPPSSGSPNLIDCVPAGSEDCVNQMDFILSKSRAMAQYDLENTTGGSTRVVFTLPTKNYHCALNGSLNDFNGVPSAPFSCQGEDTAADDEGGEQIGCIPYNRIEDYLEGDDIFSPGVDGSLCKLPREMSIVAVVADDSGTSTNVASVADELINVSTLPREHLSGWVDFNLVRDPAYVPADPSGWEGWTPDCLAVGQYHALSGIDVNLLGAPYLGFGGLPVLSLTLQEYLNANLQPVGVYGGTVPTPYEVDFFTLD